MTENYATYRYVKRVSANQEMSHNKILARNRSGSAVLEFGAASSAMMEVMAVNLKCTVSIVKSD